MNAQPMPASAKKMYSSGETLWKKIPAKNAVPSITMPMRIVRLRPMRWAIMPTGIYETMAATVQIISTRAKLPCSSCSA